MLAQTSSTSSDGGALRVTARMGPSTNLAVENWTLALVNSGELPLRVVDLDPTCECVHLEGEFKALELRPGEEVALRLKVAGRPADASVVPGVRIWTDDTDDPVVWTELPRR